MSMENVLDNLDELNAKMDLLFEVFAGPIAAHKQRQAEYARQALRAKEQGAPGPNHEKNLERLAQEAERAKSYPKRQS